MCSPFYTLAGDYLLEMTCKNKAGRKRRAKQVAGVETTLSLSLPHSHTEKICSAKKRVSGPKYILALKKEGIIWGKYHSEWKQIEDLSVPVFCLGKLWVMNGTWGERILTENKKLGTFLPSFIFCNPQQHSDHLGGTYLFLVLCSRVGKQKALSPASRR